MRLSGYRFRYLTLVLSCGACLMSSAVLMAQPESPPKPAERAKSPDNAAEKKARTQIEQVFDANYQKLKTSKKASDKLDLAKLLFDHAKDPANDVALRYVCLTESRKLMEQGGSAAGALQAIDLMNEMFDIVPLALKVDSLVAVTGKSVDDHKGIVDQVLLLIEELEQAHQYDQLIKLSQTAHTAATKSKDKKLIKVVTELRQSALDQKQEFDVYQKAVAKLEKAPGDPDANLIVGRFLCLVDGDWEAGGPKLLKGSDQQFKRIAEREAKRPKDLSEVIKLAEDWQGLSVKQAGTFKSRMLRESAYWYYLGSLEATGIQKALCEKMAAQDSRVSPRKPAYPGLVQSVYEGTDFNKLVMVRIRPNIDDNFGHGGAAPGLPGDNFSIRWVGLLRVMEPGTYTLSYNHDDGGRMWLDGINLVDNFGPAATEFRDVMLTVGLHPIKVEYCERGVSAGAILKWKIAGSELEAKPIPASAFICDPNVGRVRTTPRVPAETAARPK